MKKLLLVCSLFLIGHLLNGQSLSEVVLVDIDDSKYYNLNQLIGDSRTLIIFVDNDCPYVDYYNTRIKDLADFAVSNKLKVLFVNPHQQKIPNENSLNQMQAFMKKVKWNGRFMSDPKQQLVELLKANKLPEVFIVEASNDKVKVLFKGPIDDNPQNSEYVNHMYAKDAIEQVVNKGSVKSNNLMNTMGCRIRKF